MTTARDTNKSITILITISMMGIGLCCGSNYAWSVFSTPLAEYNDWTYSFVSFAYSLMLFLHTFFGVSSGKILKKHHVSKVILSTGLIWALAWFLAGTVSFAPLLLLGYSILGALGVGILYHAGLTACIRLYPGRRGFASGLFTGASGIASFFVAPFARFMLDITNVKFAFKAIALCFTVFTLFAFVMARREEKCVHTITETDNLNDCSWKLLIKDRNFKFVFTAFLFGAVPGVSLIGHAAAIGVELINLTPWVAAMMVSIIAVANFIGRIIFGWVSDKIGNEHTLIISGILSFSAIILLSISKDILMFIIAIVIICMGFGCIFAVFPSLVAELFRKENSSVNYPIVFLSYGFSAVIGPFGAGIIKDITGSFELSFLVSALSIVIFLLCIFRLQRR